MLWYYYNLTNTRHETMQVNSWEDHGTGILWNLAIHINQN